MKLIYAIVQDKDSNRLSNAFIESDVRATKLATTGGFLKSGNTTFIVGIEDERVNEVLDIIKETCQSRRQYITNPVSIDMSVDASLHRPIEVEIGGATVFVTPVDSFHQY